MTAIAGYFRIRRIEPTIGDWKSPHDGNFPGVDREQSGYSIVEPEPTGFTGQGKPNGAFGFASITLKYPDGITDTDYNYIMVIFTGVLPATPYVEVEVELRNTRGTPAWVVYTGYAHWPTVRRQISIAGGYAYYGVEMVIDYLVAT